MQINFGSFEKIFELSEYSKSVKEFGSLGCLISSYVLPMQTSHKVGYWPEKKVQFRVSALFASETSVPTSVPILFKNIFERSGSEGALYGAKNFTSKNVEFIL